MTRVPEPKSPSLSNVLTRSGGRSVARLIKLVSATSTTVTEPPDLVEKVEALHPSILAVWHGQFMMLSHLKRDHLRYAAMVARHGDAELIGEAMSAFGLDLIRGAGAGERRKDRGGAQALRGAVQALQGSDGRPPASVVMTADVPPGPARKAGDGIITLARLSGRPIQPIAVASSRYHALRTWSRMTINLPFSKLAFVAAEPIFVLRDASPEQLEAYRIELEQKLNAATLRAYEIAGADPQRATPPHVGSRPRVPGVLLKGYLSAMAAARPLAGHVLRHREKRGKEDPLRAGERRGIAGRPRPAGRLVWVHAASVGETNAVLPLITALRKQRPDAAILLTTTTLTSARIAAERLPDNAFHQFAPLDVPAFARSFLDHWRPDLAVFTESEIWPSLVLETHARGIPMALVNGRLSPRSYKRWTKLSSFAEPLFGRFDVILAQTEKLARWFRDVGGRNVVPAGNLKADAPAPSIDGGKLAELRAAFGDRPHLLAASTHEGEEQVIAAAHRILAQRFAGFATIIVPRHPERGPQIAALLGEQGFRVSLRSRSETFTAEEEIYVADTLGELGTFYALSPVALMGGSLIPHGGQNPLEGVSLGAALLTGPHIHNFKAEYQALQKADAVTQVTTAEDIAREAARLVGDPTARERTVERARGALESLKGALSRTLAVLLPLLPGPVPDDTGAGAPSSAGEKPLAERLERAG